VEGREGVGDDWSVSQLLLLLRLRLLLLLLLLRPLLVKSSRPVAAFKNEYVLLYVLDIYCYNKYGM